MCGILKRVSVVAAFLPPASQYTQRENCQFAADKTHLKSRELPGGLALTYRYTVFNFQPANKTWKLCASGWAMQVDKDVHVWSSEWRGDYWQYPQQFEQSWVVLKREDHGQTCCHNVRIISGLLTHKKKASKWLCVLVPAYTLIVTSLKWRCLMTTCMMMCTEGGASENGNAHAQP